MSMTQASSEYFEQVAGQWDELRTGYFGEAVREAAIAKAYLRPEMVVADIGSGTGFMAAGLAPLVRRVYAVDGSPAMLEVARRKLAGFDNIEFHEAEGLSLPFPDESLDAVFANMYLHHCPEPLAAMREMVRVLRPGGRLVITDMDSHPYAWLKDEMADVWQGFERAQVREWLREAGLVNRVVDCTGQSCCAESKTGQECTSDTSCAGPTLESSAGQKAMISVFVASGTRRMAMREAVEAAYSNYARAGSCGCSSKSSPAESAAQPSAGAATSGCCSGGTTDQAAGTVKTSGCCSGSETTAASTSACCSGETKDQAGGTAKASGCCSGSEAAAVSTSSCCSGQTAESIEAQASVDMANASAFYTPDELSAVPAEAAEIPLGCGNPVAIANLRPGEVVLDIGSGGGLDSFLAAGRVGPGGRVIGVDMTPAMLERARAAAKRANIANVEFRQGVAEALPADDGVVDVILSNCVINLTEDKGKVFEEAFRVLKPGGRLEVSDIVAGGPVPMEAREDHAGWSECVTGALPEAEYLDLIAQAGFQHIQVRRSPTAGTVADVNVYSAIVSAVKPV